MNIKMMALILGLGAIGLPALAQDINMGDDSSEWANDGECDDPRFVGVGMASNLDIADVGKDATDCRNQLEDGRIALWDREKARAATVCSEIRFGDDSSEWAQDGECDDVRFQGAGMADILDVADTWKDAQDCRQLCEAGKIFLRDY